MGRGPRTWGAATVAAALAVGIAASTGSAPSSFGGAVVASAATEAPPDGATLRASHPRVYLDPANRARLRGLLQDGDPAALRFRTLVNTALGNDDVYAYQAWYSALMGALTGRQRYCDDAVDRVRRLVRAERRRIAAGQVPVIAGDQYLEVGPRVAEIALTYDWCHASVPPRQRRQWVAFANQAVWNVWNHEDARWGGRAAPWPGWSVDNPFNNYYYSFLEATELLGLATKGEHENARRWLSKFRNAKIQRQLVPAFDAQLHGGGSREGTGYGTAMRSLWWLYDVWESSTGESIADLTTHARLSMAYLMHATVPTLDRIAPIGDHARDSTAALFDYHREYGLALARLFPDDPLTARLRTWLADNSVPTMTQQFQYVYDFLYGGGPTTTAPLATLNPTYFADGAGHLFTRDSWDTDATWIELAMGAYTESHAHQDQLSFLLYDEGWLAYDPNVDAHSGLRQETGAHNLVDVLQGGTSLPQWEGGSSEVLRLTDHPDFTYAAADSTDVYTHPSTGEQPVMRMQREIVHLDQGVLVVYDRVAAQPGTSYRWQLSSPHQPVVAGNTASWDDGRLVDHRIAPASATPTVKAWKTIDSDYSGGYRFSWTVPGGDQAEFLNVLVVDDAATAVTAAAQGSRDGVTITFASGGTATIRFERDAVGGTIALTGAAGSYDGALPSGVETLPLLAP